MGRRCSFEPFGRAIPLGSSNSEVGHLAERAPAENLEGRIHDGFESLVERGFRPRGVANFFIFKPSKYLLNI